MYLGISLFSFIEKIYRILKTVKNQHWLRV